MWWNVHHCSSTRFAAKLQNKLHVFVVCFTVALSSLMTEHVQSWTKVWDTFTFLGCFPIHTGLNPPLTPQTMLDACTQNFFRVSTLYRVGGGRTARKFRKECTVLGGNREMTVKYKYCSTVPGTFVQDCSTRLLVWEWSRRGAKAFSDWMHLYCFRTSKSIFNSLKWNS